MIEQLINNVSLSISEKESLVLTMGETAKDSVYFGQRYGAFPETNSTKPIDGERLIPDSLNEKFSNETVSLADIGVTAEEFNVVNGVGFQYKKPNGSIGFYILYSMKATVEDQTDIDFLSSKNIEASVGDVILLTQKVDYTPVSYGDWSILNETREQLRAFFHIS